MIEYNFIYSDSKNFILIYNMTTTNKDKDAKYYLVINGLELYQFNINNKVLVKEFTECILQTQPNNNQSITLDIKLVSDKTIEVLECFNINVKSPLTETRIKHMQEIIDYSQCCDQFLHTVIDKNILQT